MITQPKLLLFIVHRLYFARVPKKGGIDRIIEYAREKNSVTLIEHPFEIINHTADLTQDTTQFHHQPRFRGPLLWMEECAINIYWIFQTHKKYDMAIASDPLNFFSCYVLKMFGRVKKTQFHSTDYSRPRFNNPVFEFVYQYLYRFAVTHADIITVVSKRMEEHARTLVRHHRMYLLPNSPEFSKIPKIPYKKRLKNSLVLLVGRWGNQIDTHRIRECMKQLITTQKRIKLHIIGHVDKPTQRILTNGTRSAYVFHGSLPYVKALQIMAQCAIGVTAYKATESYVHFADSLKIREYAGAGLPIVCDDVYATAGEVAEYRAGYVYTTTDEMISSILRLLQNTAEYRACSTNALHWAKKNDKRTLLKKLYGKYTI